MVLGYPTSKKGNMEVDAPVENSMEVDVPVVVSTASGAYTYDNGTNPNEVRSIRNSLNGYFEHHQISMKARHELILLAGSRFPSAWLLLKR